MIGWFRKWWPWGRESEPVRPENPPVFWAPQRYNELHYEMHTLMDDHYRAVKAKKKRSHIEARMKEIRTELLRMEAGK